MSSLVARPLVVASFFGASLVLLGFLWKKQRQQASEESSSDHLSPSLEIQQKQFKAVQAKLATLNRGRLETLAEEKEPIVLESKECVIVEVCQLEQHSVEKPQTVVVTEDKLVIESDIVKKTKKAEPIFSCTDIRYRHLKVSDTLVHTPVDEDDEEEADKVIIEISSDSRKEKMGEEVIEKEVVIEEALFEEELTEEEMTLTSLGPKEKVPSVLAALQDALCSSHSPSYSSSPEKSESSSEGRQSTEWSDLIEQDERDNFQQALSDKLSGLELEKGRTRSGDSGVVSPSETSESEARERPLSETAAVGKTRSQSGEDAGIGSEQGDVFSDPGGVHEGYEDCRLMSYQYHIPDYLCGKLIGVQGTFIKKLKEDCRCNIVLKELVGEVAKSNKRNRKMKMSQRDRKYGEGKMKVCCIEGTRSNIDKCLDILKVKFLESPELTFEQTNIGEREVAGPSVAQGQVCLNMAEGIMHEVFVSSIVGGGHVFLQQPYHPTFTALERLDQCMQRTYSTLPCPPLPSPIQLNTVAVAPHEGGWYRCQVVAHDPDTDLVDIKYLDYGGYHSIPASELKQIRTDFLSLPFQAIECYLANVTPSDAENVSAFVLEELIAHQIVQARMIGTNESGVPMIHLYRAVNGQTTMVNRELVDRNCASWIDTTIVQLDAPVQPET